MTRYGKSLVAAALAATTMVPAVAEEPLPCTDEEGELVFADEHTAYVKEGTTKAGNLAALGAQDYPTWSDEEPTASVTGGAGGGYLTNRIVYNVTEHELARVTFQGTFTGCLDAIAVELYVIEPTDEFFAEPHTILADLTIDGVPVYGSLGNALETNSEVNPNGSITLRTRFAFIGLHRALTSQFAGEVDLEGTHDIELTVLPFYTDVPAAIYVWDTVEVPSNLVFNPTSLAGYAVVEQNFS